MPMLKDDYQKTEKINGVIYNMTSAANFRHGIVNGNIYARIREGLKNSLCLAFIENLDYKYHPDILQTPQDIVVKPPKNVRQRETKIISFTR